MPGAPGRGQVAHWTMHTRLNPRAWSLARQLFALQVVVVAVVVLAAGTAAYLQDGQRSQDSTSDRVLAIARSVAASPTVRSALPPPLVRPSDVLQPYAEQVRRDTGTDFVVVMNTDRTDRKSTRLNSSHANISYA